MSKTHEKYRSGDPITWAAVNNLLPFVAIFVSVVGVYTVMATKIEVQSQQIKYLDTKAEACLSDIRQLKSEVQSQSLDLKEVQTKTERGQVQGVSTSSGSMKRAPSPTPVK